MDEKQKRKHSLTQSNIDEFENFIFSDEECENISIPSKYIQKYCSDSDDDKSDEGTNNKNSKKDNNKRNKQSNKNNKTSKTTERNNKKNNSETSENNKEYYDNWRSKRSRFESNIEKEWNDEYDDYMYNLIPQNVVFNCNNPNCDHLIYSDLWYTENKITITTVNTLDDLIFLGNYYHCQMRKTYNEIDMKVLYEIREPLQELNNMIGLSMIKEEIVNTIIYFLLTKNLSKEINSDMMHSVITGSPGSGKTTFIEILAKIYVGLGVLKKGHIVKTRRSELIGKYLGHTAVQTQKKIEEAHGGILLIDEAYALGNPEGRDSFSKECLDTLNQALSENKTDFICIIAGYKDALDSSFFKYNEGLKRRFPFRYDIDKYTSDELSMILYKKIEEYGHYGTNKISLWHPEFTKMQLQKLIKDNFDNFKNQGGDMESIFLGAKIAQNKRVFLLEKHEKNKLMLSDIKTSINKFLELHKLKDNFDDYTMRTMYI